VNIIGGSAEADWLADRDRKVGLIREMSSDIVGVSHELRSRGALLGPTPAILREFAFAADWYVSVAGFALKTLGYIKDGPSARGATIRVRTIRDNLAAGRDVSDENLEAFCAWLTDQYEMLWPDADSEMPAEIAIIVVSALLGGRALGQGQNQSGSAAVFLLRSAIVQFAHDEGLSIEGRGDDGTWRADDPSSPAVIRDSLRVDERLICHFPTGGDTPDVLFRIDGTDRPLAIGEVKGRKDTSNVWESWMPQVADHMRTWSREFRQSWRLMFGTLITEPMVEGESASGTERKGLKSLHEGGNLDGVYNLAKLADQDAIAWDSFRGLMRALLV